MSGMAFFKSAAVSAAKVAALFLTQLLLTQVFTWVLPPNGSWGVESLVRALLRTSVFVVCAWLLEVGPARRAALNEHARTVALVEASAESVVTIDARGHISSLNTAAQLLLQRTGAELEGRCIHLVAGLEELSWLCRCSGARPAEYRSGRFAYRAPSGRSALVDWLATPLPLEGGGGAVLSMRDVTAEVQSLERAQLQAAALDAAANSIFIIDTQGRIEWVNAAFRRVTGYGDEVIGQTPDFLKSGAHDEAFYQQLWQTVGSGDAWSGEVINRRRDGTLFSCLSTVTPVAVEGGTATHYVAVSQDITQQRDLEKRLAVSERMASLGTLAAGVAHEINNPLSFITSNLDYVRTYIEHGEGNPAEVISALVDANMGAQRVRKIVLALRSFSRVGDGPQRPVDVRCAVEQALTIAGSQIKSHAQLVVKLQDTPMVRADEGRLSQVFLNLLVNAAQAIAPGSPGTNEVRVTSSLTPNGEVVVEVSDTGCGLSQSAREHLFEPFFTTKPVGVGTGLGLYICHNLIHGMGGELSLESVEGKGTTFRVRLPPATAPDATCAGARPAAHAA